MDFVNDGPRRPGEVGIDLGIAQTVTLSDGTVFQLDVESIKKHEKQIAVLQRQLCRNKEARQKLAKLGKANPFDKREPSRKRRRLKAKIQNHHRCIRNIRRDFMLKTAHTIAQNYGGVAMEDLKLKNMTKSAKGTVEEPGKNVSQKTGLNRSLARVAPYAMRMYSRPMDDSFSSIRNTRARPARSADARVRQIDLRRRISVVRNAGTPRMPTSWGQPMSSRRAGQAQFARVVSLATRQQREPSFSSRLDAK